MKRACLLSLLVLVSMVTLLPFVDSAAQREAEAASLSRHHHRRAHMSARRYRMWLRHRRAMRRRRARALSRARERRHQAILAAAGQQHRQRTVTTAFTKTYSPAQSLTTPIVRRTPQQSTFMMTPASGSAEMGTRAPVAMSTPGGWQRESMAINGEARFTLHNSDGSRAGAAFLTPLSARSLGAVAASAGRTALRNQIAGVSFSNLRRTIIDKMIQERGWVANDMEREIGGRRTFIVLAQTGDNQVWTYYFTELNGQLYSLAVKAPASTTTSVAAQAEQLLVSLRSNNQPAVAAEPQH